jgi:hypothetical protein
MKNSFQFIAMFIGCFCLFKFFILSLDLRSLILRKKIFKVNYLLHFDKNSIKKRKLLFYQYLK